MKLRKAWRVGNSEVANDSMNRDAMPKGGLTGSVVVSSIQKKFII